MDHVEGLNYNINVIALMRYDHLNIETNFQMENCSIFFEIVHQERLIVVLIQISVYSIYIMHFKHFTHDGN
jgi:hypothetical protein